MVNEKNEFAERTKSFALRIMKLADSLPKTISGKAIANQIIRSGTSIAANYREAQRARTKSEFISKINISLGEAAETELWLELITNYGMFGKGKLSALSNENSEIIAILCAMVKSAKKNKDNNK